MYTQQVLDNFEIIRAAGKFRYEFLESMSRCGLTLKPFFFCLFVAGSSNLEIRSHWDFQQKFDVIVIIGVKQIIQNPSEITVRLNILDKVIIRLLKQIKALQLADVYVSKVNKLRYFFNEHVLTPKPVMGTLAMTTPALMAAKYTAAIAGISNDISLISIGKLLKTDAK